MVVSTRIAGDWDLPFLRRIDPHVPDHELSRVVSMERILIAEVDGTAVGLLRWGKFWDEIPFMNLLYVLPEHRCQGVGTTLVDAWENSQLVAGHNAVLTSTSAAETAQHLYRRLGYVDSGGLLLPDEPTELILRKP
jgi:GNAT superfamily N-acetyltransferase